MRTRMALAIVAAVAGVAAASRPAEARHFGRAVVFPAPVVFPGVLNLLPSGVYFARAPGVDAYFADGYWWAPYQGGWYRALDWEGPWVLVGDAYVPVTVYGLPPRLPLLLPRASVVPWGPWHAEHRYVRYGDRDDRRARPPQRAVQRGPDRPGHSAPANYGRPAPQRGRAYAPAPGHAPGRSRDADAGRRGPGSSNPPARRR